MMRVAKDTEAHYETYEVPFGRSYKWHPEKMTIECECGEKLTIAGTSRGASCRCGADYATLIQDIQRREENLQDDEIHPWHHDSQSQADQHLKDEATHATDSSWRYNDVTSSLVGDDEGEMKEDHG
jgi:hypothetical protein